MKKKIGSFESNRGITLVALIVTIVVLIILATISIDVVLGENGILKKAQQVEELYNNNIITEEKEMNVLVQDYNNMMVYQDHTLPVRPSVAEGMTKVKYNSKSKKWKKVTDDTTEWYNYGNREWANVVLGGATWNSDGTLDESQPYTQLVWIPRFAYKITSQYHTSGETAGNIDIVFIGTDNKGIDGIEYSTTYPKATDGGGMDDFVVHPAFDYGGTHLAGFWIGKFESSHTDCTTAASTGKAGYTGNEVMTVRAGVTSWRNLTINQMFTTCIAMNKSGNPYGLNTSDSVVDPHLTKNDEWGAVAYLSKSSYGKETEEVYINNSSTYITGNAGGTAGASSAEGVTNAYNTTNGVKASTTGNVYGVYDISGGAWEHTAAYVANGDSSLTSYGADLVAEGTASKYKNVYAKGSSDTQELNYGQSTPTNGHYGDAIYETSDQYSTSSGSWYSDYSSFPTSSSSFFERGRLYSGGSGCGVFAFAVCDGSSADFRGFRVVVPVL